MLPVQARDLADKALASFVIIQAALRRSRRLHAYTLREDLNRRMPGFTVPPLGPCPARRGVMHDAASCTVTAHGPSLSCCSTICTARALSCRSAARRAEGSESQL